MSGSAFELCELIRRKAPELLDILTAQNNEQFEKGFDALLEKAVVGLETNKDKFATLDEEGLSAALAMALSVPGFSVSREKHSNGHVDITIEVHYCVPNRKKLGEAKIYDGPSYHIDGLQQLLGRYTTGREGRGLLIAYVRKKGISGLVTKIREKMDLDLPANQKGPTLDHALKWSFLSVHGHSSGEEVEVSHVGCNLYLDH